MGFFIFKESQTFIPANVGITEKTAVTAIVVGGGGGGGNATYNGYTSNGGAAGMGGSPRATIYSSIEGNYPGGGGGGYGGGGGGAGGVEGCGYVRVGAAFAVKLQRKVFVEGFLRCPFLGLGDSAPGEDGGRDDSSLGLGILDRAPSVRTRLARSPVSVL